MNRYIIKVGKLLNHLVKKTTWYKNEIFEDCTKFWDHKTFNLDLINLGSTSSVYAFNYQECKNLKAANFALSHNPLLGDEAILKNYCSYLKKGAVVIVSLCPFSSLAGSYDDFDDRYYTLLYSSSIPNFSKKRFNKVMHVKNRPIKYYPLFSFLNVIKSFFKNDEETLTMDALERDSEKWISSWAHEFSLDSMESDLKLIQKDAVKDSVDIVTRIIDFCIERSFKPVLVIPPMHEALADKFTEICRENIISPLFALASKKNVITLNYMDSNEFKANNALFRNSFILNKKGSIEFTKTVLCDINKHGLI